MNFRAKFQAELAKLNPAQRQAVETIEGPLLIVAGPGTGKTQTVALRLAHILATTQARPHNLLALTFTESGAIALKKRLASIIGPEGYGITATTFHSFAQQLAGMFPTEFGIAEERITLDEFGAFALIRELLAAGDFPLLRPVAAPDLYIRDIVHALSTLKREGYTPERFLELVTREQDELAGQERINPRTKKPYLAIQQQEKKIAKNLELVQMFTAYERALRERDLADYDDLILHVVETLTPHPGTLPEGERKNRSDFVLAYLQENYLYVTVDEFQDTNGAQSAILSAWASYDAKPNLCVVGDDDQSIYRFQGASLANILDFRKQYADVAIVTLTQNYRSTQPILDTARSLIEHNKQRLTYEIPGLSKELKSVKNVQAVQSVQNDSNKRSDRTIRTSAAIEQLPQIVSFPTEEDEAVYVVTEIQKLLARKVPPTEIAVLYRKRRHADLIASYLTRAGVPHYRKDGSDALVQPRVQALIALLAAIANPRDGAAIARVLFAPDVGLAPADAYRLTRVLDTGNSLFDIFTKPDALKVLAEPTDYRPAIVFAEPERVQQFVTRLLDWTAAAHEVGLTELSERIAAESGLSAGIIAKKEYVSATALAAFIGFVRDFEVLHPAVAAEVTLPALLTELTTRIGEGFTIPVPPSELAAVSLMTAHGSKGLEFAHVFVVHVTDNDWGGRKKPDKLPLPALVGSAGEDGLVEDERRLLYVALTRARESLILTTAKLYSGRELAPSRFLAEISVDTCERREVVLTAADKLSFTAPLELAPTLDPDSRRFLSSLVERLRISATALNTYLMCPQKFLFESLLRVPASVDVSDRAGAIFGIAIHAGLEEWFRVYKQTSQKPAITVALAALERRLLREALTTGERETFVRDAGRALEKYLAHIIPTAEVPLEIEFNYGKHEIRLGDIPLTGKADRIDLLPGTGDAVRIVDYKSQKPYARNAILGLTANSTGDIYRQLTFYKLLTELDTRFPFRFGEGVISFIRPDDAGKFVEESFTPTDEEVAALKVLIADVFAKIQALEFACTEDAEKCRNCRLKGMCGR